MRRLSHESLFGLRELETRPLPDAALAAFAAAQNARVLDALAEHATLLGDRADLPTSPRPAAAEVADPPEADVRRATEALHAGALALCAELGLRAARVGDRHPPGGGGRGSPPGGYRDGHRDDG